MKLNQIEKNYTPFGKKDCEGICNRESFLTPTKVIVVCHGCKRIVMEKELKRD